MSSTFWLNGKQLDDEQRHAVENIDESESFLLTGPAGSGKTNILLLRAKWLTLSGLSNLKIIVFTKSLRQFLQNGCAQYGISSEIVTTQMSFFRSILQEYSIAFESSNNFEGDRGLLAGKVMSLIESNRISQSYIGALLVDEAQDYTDTELQVFRGLTKRLILASDVRQSIYKATHTPGLPQKIVGGKVVALQFHYRSGLKLCKVADAILSDSSAFPRVQAECRYPENLMPSSVTAVSCGSFDDQMKIVVDNIVLQLDLYPNQPIGVLFPKREQELQFEEFLRQSSKIPNASRIIVDTMHGAKGWEFPAVHLVGCESLYRMGPIQKRLIYTSVLRGKTSVHVYFTGHLPGYLDSALAILEPPRGKPDFERLF